MLPVDICLLKQTSLIRARPVTPEGGGAGASTPPHLPPPRVSYLEPDTAGAEARPWPPRDESGSAATDVQAQFLGGKFEVSQELRLDNQPLGPKVAFRR